MNAAPFFEVADAQPHEPFGKCVLCKVQHDPMIAIFWAPSELGSVCPDCAGLKCEEGYDFVIFVSRKDKPYAAPSIHGPYSAGEAERTRRRFLQFENVSEARVAPKPEWF